MYTLGDIPRKSALYSPEREAVVFEATRLTYREFNTRINRLANGLVRMGFKKGDRVTVLAENTHKYLEVYFAAAKLGMSVTPLNFRLSDDEIIHIVNDSEAACFFAGDDYLEEAAGMRSKIRDISVWIGVDGNIDGFIDYEVLLKDASDKEPEVDVDEDDLAVLMYTGGTTGLPKGVMLSHRNIITGVINANLISGTTRDDATCYVLPLFHVSFWPAFCLLLAGGKVAINRKPDLNEILRIIQDERCTHMNAVPTVYGWLLQFGNVDAYNISSLKLLSYAGSPFPPEILKQCMEKFGPIFAQGYGATETAGGAITLLREEDHALSGPKTGLLVSAGKASLCSEIRIVDPEGHPLPANETGEITVRGKHVMVGYWKNPEQTRKALRDGWYHTGDMGFMDENGYLFLRDRKADMIVTGGENVYPKEVEDVLYEHPAVSMAAVVSAPDQRWGERVQAVVVLKPGQNATEEALIAFCKKRLGGYKCPKSVEFWDALPTTPIGKILRKDVKKKFWQGQGRLIG
ncbi:MAG: long-chain-fatty-acid--CoA ligase [Desulfosalsimonadaceae bacterium]|nr:long-chain-fatty-acid--CoA ligase [Desulfosalsimonadaceae bacterium]